jgi:UDPglucose 6-dehydrogenase
MSLPIVGFAGMTHLGLVSGVSASEKGFSVVCFDPNTDRMAALNKGVLPVSEPQLDDLVAKNSSRLRFTSESADLQSCEVIYVAPDDATDELGQSELQTINTLLDVVFKAVRSDAVIVVLSQVPPGYTRSKQFTGRILYYQVETLIFGRAVERALFPERYIVGCADPVQALPEAYDKFLKAHGCPILPMRYESAELAKISINMCLVASISTANTLAELCEKIGADWSEIVPALKLDRRIGHYSYLSPGLGIAGGNLERDLATVCNFADTLGTDAGVVRAWLANSSHRKNWAADTIKKVLLDINPKAVVAVWGLAYKENTHSIKNSPSLVTIKKLQHTTLQLHDPEVSTSVVNNAKAIGFTNAIEAAKGADALMILTPWPEYRQIAVDKITSAMRGRIVLDPYAVLDAKVARSLGLAIYTLGQAPDYLNL